jgi:hypothetical protein
VEEYVVDKKVWLVAGADAMALAEQKVADLTEQLDAYCDLSMSLALNDLQPAGNRR